jgi:hypothetical protein
LWKKRSKSLYPSVHSSCNFHVSDNRRKTRRIKWPASLKSSRFFPTGSYLYFLTLRKHNLQ